MEGEEKMNSQGHGWSWRRRKRRKGANGGDVMGKEEEEKQWGGETMKAE